MSEAITGVSDRFDIAHSSVEAAFAEMSVGTL
jgi:hypothetical protein